MSASLRNLMRRLPSLPGWSLGRPARAEGRPAAPKAVLPTATPEVRAAAPPPPTAVTAEALAEAALDLSDRLWGAGFALPGGATEVLKLASLMPLSPATTVLVLGNDAGGAAHSIATARGAWLAVHLDNPLLATRTTMRLTDLGRRAAVLRWDPREPLFRHRYHHHALALDALRRSSATKLLAALAAGLKPGGQLVMADVVTDATNAGRVRGALERWCELEGRASMPPTADAMQSEFARQGFTLHVSEDAGARHRRALMEAWARVIDEMQQGGRPPNRAAAMALVAEAERWLLRQKLMEAGALRILRWHATVNVAANPVVAW